MGTKRSVGSGAGVVRQPVAQQGLEATLRVFVASFVIEDKRAQIHKRLLGAARRIETLETLSRWLAGRTAPLEGADRSPAGLGARFGELIGVQLDAAGAHRTTIAGALELARDRPSLFVGDTGRVAMITGTGGPPLLCSPA